MKITQPLKWHGGKHYLAPKIIALMPKHTHYVEPYAGGLSVMLAKDPEGVSEVANDINGPLTNFWRCMACRASFEAFERQAQAIPFCETLWAQALEKVSKPCDASDMICQSCALAFFVVCRQSLAGRMTNFAPLSKTRVRRGMNEQASAWMNAVDGLPEVHARLRRVAILNRPALDVIRQQDAPDTLFYLDPPYLHETRATTGEYAHEMSYEQHAELLDVLRSIKGKFMLSGYRSQLYDSAASEAGNWRLHQFELPNNSAAGKSKRRMVEALWCNF